MIVSLLVTAVMLWCFFLQFSGQLAIETLFEVSIQAGLGGRRGIVGTNLIARGHIFQLNIGGVAMGAGDVLQPFGQLLCFFIQTMGFGMFKRTRVTGIIGAARSGQDGVRKVTEAQRTGKFVFVFFGFDNGGVVDLWYFLSTQGCGCGRWFSPSVGTRRGVVGAMAQHVHLQWLIVVGWWSSSVVVVDDGIVFGMDRCLPHVGGGSARAHLGSTLPNGSAGVGRATDEY